MQLPSSHSLDTWDQDEFLPLDPTLGEDGGSLVSPGLLAALSGYKAVWQAATCLVTGASKHPPPLVSMAWLGQLSLLEKLRVCFYHESDVDWGTCPTKQGVKELYLKGEFVLRGGHRKGWNPSETFPKLEVLEVQGCFRYHHNTDMLSVIANVQDLPSLRCIVVSDLAFHGEHTNCQRFDFSAGPSDVRGVSYKAVWWEEIPHAFVLPQKLPQWLANRLTNFEVVFRETDMDVEESHRFNSGGVSVSLGCFSAYPVLKNIDFTFCTTDEDADDLGKGWDWCCDTSLSPGNGNVSYIRFLDFSKLPHSVERVRFRVRGNGDRAWRWLPTIQLTPGWEFELTQPKAGVAFSTAYRV